MQVEVKCREYEYVYARGTKIDFQKMRVEGKFTNLEADEIGAKHAIEEFLSTLRV